MKNMKHWIGQMEFLKIVRKLEKDKPKNEEKLEIAVVFQTNLTLLTVVIILILFTIFTHLYQIKI